MATRKQGTRLRGRCRGRLAAGAAAIAAAAGLAVAGCSGPTVLGGAVTSGSGGSAAGAGPWSSAFASPASSIAAHNPFTGPPADPFAGTPADHWADDAAGVALPAARPIGGFTAAQVDFAYQRTRTLLAAAALNRRTLLGGSPAAFASLLTNQQRTWFLGRLDKTGLDKQGYELSSRTMVMSFAPGSAQLIGSVIKVHGTMRAHSSTHNGYSYLDVHVDYLFVYPVQPPHRPTQWMRIVNEERWTVSFGDWAGAATSFEPWVNEDGGGVAGALCGTRDGYAHPDYPDNRSARPAVSPTGTPVDPYVAGQQRQAGCNATTGT